MAINKKTYTYSLPFESIDELFDAGYIQFVVRDGKLDIELTGLGLDAYICQSIQIRPTRPSEDPAFAHFRKQFWIYISIVVTSLILMSFVIRSKNDKALSQIQKHFQSE